MGQEGEVPASEEEGLPLAPAEGQDPGEEGHRFEGTEREYGQLNERQLGKQEQEQGLRVYSSMLYLVQFYAMLWIRPYTFHVAVNQCVVCTPLLLI